MKKFFSESKNHPEIFENEVLIKERNPKWEPILKKLPRISRHNLYIRIQQNRASSCDKKKIQGLRDRLKKYFLYNSENSSIADVKTEHVNETGIEKENVKPEEKRELIQVEDDQLKYYEDEYDELHRIKYDVNYGHSVSSISCIKTEIIYFSKEQLDLLKDFINSNAPILFFSLEKMFRKTRMRNYLSEPLSYMSVSVSIEQQPISFAQALAESLDNLFIQNFILRILKSNIPLPSKVIITFQQSLLDGICIGLNQCSFQKYNANCYRNCKPEVHIFIDVVSILVAVSNLKLFESKPKLVRNFYLQCLIQLSLCSNQENFDKMLQDIFEVMFAEIEVDSKYCSQLLLKNQFNNPEHAKNYNIFQTYLKEDKLSKLLFPNKINLKAEETTEHEILDHIKKIQESAVSQINTNAVNYNTIQKSKANAYYLPELYEHLEVILSYYLCWTNIMDSTDNFNVVSSCVCDTFDQFNELDPSPLIVSKFIKYHINAFKLNMQAGRLLEKKRSSSTVQFEGNKSHHKHRCLSFEENWNNKNSPQDCSIDPSIVDRSMVDVSMVDVSIVNVSLVVAPIVNRSMVDNSDDIFENVQFLQAKKMVAIKESKEPKKHAELKSKEIKRRKYVTPCPGMKVIHEQKTKIKSLKENLIINEELKGLKLVNKIRYKLGNSSKIDSGAEIIKFSYLNYRDFQVNKDLN
ncbi:hypothetical protein TKK_0015323 [Trichogramma kaykai]|uniref:Uncharacterized protein n=1 Tax=Trichogramma kaykai TaxID=54128 RepID=A0ABD2W9J6_9HYME